MKFYSNRKPIEITNDYQINGETLDVKKKWLAPCTLTLANSTVILLLNKPFDNKTVLYLEKDWTVNASDKEDDFELVSEHNKMVQSFFGDLELLNNGIEAAIGASMSSVYISKQFWICPGNKWLLDMSQVEAVFLERMCSYTRTFDIVFCGNNIILESLNSISRKKDHKQVMDILTDVCTVYTTGPDPLEWKDLLKFKKNGHTWKEVANKANTQQDSSEESEEEWVQGQTEDEYSEVSEYDYSDLGEEGSEDEYVHVLDNEDYDNYERQSKKAKTM